MEKKHKIWVQTERRKKSVCHKIKPALFLWPVTAQDFIHSTTKSLNGFVILNDWDLHWYDDYLFMFTE